MNRIPVGWLAVSASAVIGLAVYEDYRSDAYIPAPGDKPTTGFGETEGVKLGDKTTPVRALVQLGKSAEKHAQAVRECAPVPMFQHEFDAYVSVTYNIGATAFCASTMAKKLRALDYPGACKEILRWDKFQGRALRGLTIRRQREYQTCIGS